MFLFAVSTKISITVYTILMYISTNLIMIDKINTLLQKHKHLVSRIYNLLDLFSKISSFGV